MIKNYKFQTKIDNENKDVYLFVLNQRQSNVKVPSIHHVQIIDRSGSTAYFNHTIVSHVKETIKLMRPGDLFSLLWYSGPGQFRTLLKGATVDDKTPRIVDQLSGTIATTCFSEVLSEASEVIKELASVVDMSIITLFTDGQPVVPWGAWEEERRAYRVVDEMKGLSALHTIGYGPYYNRDFLKGLSSRTQYGVFTHSRDINDYIKIFDERLISAGRLSMTPLTVESDALFGFVYSSDEPIYFSGQPVDLASTGDEVLVYCVAPKWVKINGEKVDLSEAEVIHQESIFAQSLWYSLAYQSFYDNNRRKAASILAQLGDEYLYSQVKNAFTINEVGETISKLRTAAKLSSGTTGQYRFVQGRRTIEQIGNAFCVMDLLKLLSESNAMYRPYGKTTEKYQRISAKREGGMSFFERDESRVVQTSFQNMVFSEEFLNISLRFTINGKVKLNPVQADKVGLPHTIENVTQFRNHTIIKDGQLNMSQIEVSTDDKTFLKLAKFNMRGVIKSHEIDHKNGDVNLMTLDLASIPLINDDYVAKSLDPDYILSLAREIATLKARQKVFNWFTKGLIVDESGNETTLTEYTPEQLALLKEHGLSDKLAYNDPGGGVVKSGDSYEARTLEISVKGSSLKSVSDVVKNFLMGKKMNFMDDVMLDAYQEVLGDNRDVIQLTTITLELAERAKGLLSVTKDKIREQSTLLHSLRLGMGLSGEYPQGMKVEAKGWSFDDLLIKTDRKVVEI